MKSRTGRLLVALTVVILAISGCSGGSGGKNGKGEGRIRFLNTITDQEVGSLQLYIGGSDEFVPLPYGEMTEYETHSAGKLEIRVLVPASPVPIIDESVSIGSDTDETLMFLSQPKPKAHQDYQIGIKVIKDTHEPDFDKRFNVRVINTAPSVDSFDVFYTRPNVPITGSLIPWKKNIGFGGTTGYVEGNESPAVLTIVDSKSGLLLYQSPSIDFVEHPVVTLYILDKLGRGLPVSAVYSFDSDL